MFESDIERSKMRLLEAVNGYQPSTYLRDIVAHPHVDYAYKQYFEAEFAWWLYEEQTVRRANPHVNPHDPETQIILRNLDLQYHKNARFERDQLLGMADAAVKGVLNYRVRPRTTLKWFVYRGEPTKPIHEIYLRMRYFADYNYLHEGFNQWLVRRGLRYDSLDIISVLEFERIIKKIDDDAILELSPSEFVNMIAPIGSCFHHDDDADVGIPIEAVIIFLDDKEVYVIAQKLEHLLYQQGVRMLTKQMFLAVVDEVLAEVDEESSDAPPTSGSALAHTSPSSVPPSKRIEPLTPPSSTPSDSVIPMPTRPMQPPIAASVTSNPLTTTLSDVPRDVLLRTSGAPAIDAIPVAPRSVVAPEEVPDVASDINAEPLRADVIEPVVVPSQETPLVGTTTSTPSREKETTFSAHEVPQPDMPTTVARKVEDRVSEAPETEAVNDTPSIVSERSASVPGDTLSTTSPVYPSISTLYDVRQKELFVRKICNKDESLFDELTTSIDATHNWKDALAVLDRFYAHKNIDPQSAAARDLRMIIYRRFIVA